MFLPFALGLTMFWAGLFIGVSEAKVVPKVPLDDNRIKIAIIDTGTEKTNQIQPYLCKGGHVSIFGQNPLKDAEWNQHGTNIAYLVTQGLDPAKYCILIIQFYDESSIKNLSYVIRGVKYAIEQKVTYMNLSLGGDAADSSERKVLKLALKNHIKIAVAAGNEGKDLDKDCNYYPACYKFNDENYHVVGSSTDIVKKDGTTRKYSNFGKIVKFLEDGTNQGVPANTGTSQATAIHLNKWIKEDGN